MMGSSMRTNQVFVFVTVVSFVVPGTLVLPTIATAQDQFDAGAHVAITRSSEFDATDTGFGGRVGWRVLQAIGAEAELTFYPRGFPSSDGAFSSSRIEGLFGVTVGPRRGRVRPFGKLRPGFVAFRGEPIVCPLIFPPLLSCALNGRTVFAFDVGGGIEVNMGTRSLVRFDASDRLLKYPGPSFRDGRMEQDDFFGHDLRISAGAGVRF
jgi:hypothetical protein